MYCWHTSRRYSLIERSLRKFIEVEFRTKTPLNLRIVFLVRLKNGLELLCSTTEEESHLIDENKKMYISFIEENHIF